MEHLLDEEGNLHYNIPINLALDMITLSVSLGEDNDEIYHTLESLKQSIINRIKTTDEILDWLPDDVTEKLKEYKKQRDEDTNRYNNTQQLVSMLDDVLSHYITNLTHISTVRNNLQNYQSIWINKNYCPLLVQLVEDMFDKRKEIPDLDIVTNSNLAAVKNTFNYLGLQSRQGPADNDTIILFLMGGITMDEVRLLKDRVPAGKKLIIGSTGISTPAQIRNRLIRKVYLG